MMMAGQSAPARPRTVAERAREAHSTYPAAEAAWDARYFAPGAPELTVARLHQACKEALDDGLAAWQLPRQSGTVPPPPWPDPMLYDAIKAMRVPLDGLEVLKDKGVPRLAEQPRDRIAAEVRRRGHAIYRTATGMLGRMVAAPDFAQLARAFPSFRFGDVPGVLLVGVALYAAHRWGRR